MGCRKEKRQSLDIQVAHMHMRLTGDAQRQRHLRMMLQWRVTFRARHLHSTCPQRQGSANSLASGISRGDLSQGIHYAITQYLLSKPMLLLLLHRLFNLPVIIDLRAAPRLGPLNVSKFASPFVRCFSPSSLHAGRRFKHRDRLHTRRRLQDQHTDIMFGRVLKMAERNQEMHMVCSLPQPAQSSTNSILHCSRHVGRKR